jgi:hypothetical protein
MKGKAPKTGKMSHTAYSGGKSKVASEMMKGNDGFKRGGKAKHAGMVEGVMSEAHAGRKPRKSGGGVMSSAAAGSPRAKSSHY